MTEEHVRCTKCNQLKPITGFYVCKGYRRADCKQCTIRHNVAYQKRVRAWETRISDDAHKKRQRDYYAANKEKFAQYRQKHRERNPEYYKHYFRNKKNMPKEGDVQ